MHYPKAEEAQVEAERLLTNDAGKLNNDETKASGTPRTAPGRALSPWKIFISVTAAMVMMCLLASTSPLETFARWMPSSFRGTGSAGFEDTGELFLIGTGKADITGPVVEINLMGYADPKQIGTGLRQRLYSRAFIVGCVERPNDRFVYLVLDTQSGDTAVRYGIISALKELGPAYAAYNHHNVAVTGTHSHSGPGGWLNYLLPQITSKGFDRQGYQAIVEGAVLSIRRAHESLQPGYLSVGTTKVLNANINRSLFAYLANPEEERARYNVSSEDDGSVEKDLTLVKFQRASDGKNIGILTWFPVHGTSVLGNNTLISGDNKGVAAYLFEKSVQNDDTAAEDFVAGFSQANVGDTSPNVLGAWCEDGSGQMCSFENSTCSDGRSQMCRARGPFFRVQDNGASSCFEIGKRQFEPARALYDQLNKDPTPIRGSLVKSFHTFHNMSGYTFVSNGKVRRTCPAALGYSFAAGTSDGPGAFDFTQHDGNENTTSPVWRAVSYLLKDPTDEQRACHSPKPILMDVGEMSRPYQWTPNIVDVQVFRAGQLVIVVSPGEASTMAGRRWKEVVHNAAADMFDQEAEATGSSSTPVAPVVVIGGPANSYTHYITTEEEYGIQRYEGASTLYGPHTLEAYIDVTLSFLPCLGANGGKPPRHEGGLYPQNNANRSLSFVPGVIRDGTPFFKSFGDVLTDVEPFYRRAEHVKTTFVGANPRNNLRPEDTYAAVEQLDTQAGSDVWRRVRDDSDWSLVFQWRRTSEVMGTSEVDVEWETEDWAEPGVYRLRYFGDAKSLDGTITPFEGVSTPFTVV